MTLYDPHHIEHLLGQCTPLCFIWYLETKNTNPSFKTHRAVVWSKQDVSITKVCFPVQYAQWTSQLYFKLYFLLQHWGKTCFHSDLSLLSIGENICFLCFYFSFLLFFNVSFTECTEQCNLFSSAPFACHSVSLKWRMRGNQATYFKL